jgi:uncharacterized protein (TIGR03437 family)
MYLTLFGTGFRGRTSLDAVKATLGGVDIPLSFAGPQGEYSGFDQINVGPLPRSLAGRGPVDFLLSVDGKPANILTISVQ